MKYVSSSLFLLGLGIAIPQLAMSASVTRSCSSVLEISYLHYTSASQIDTPAERQNRLKVHVSQSGYTRSSTSTGLIPSPNAARERACQYSADDRINDYHEDTLAANYRVACFANLNVGKIATRYVRSIAKSGDFTKMEYFVHHESFFNDPFIWTTPPEFYTVDEFDCKTNKWIAKIPSPPPAPVLIRGCTGYCPE